MHFLFSILAVLFIISCYVIYKLIVVIAGLAIKINDLQYDNDTLEKEVSELTVDAIKNGRTVVNRGGIFITSTQN